MNLDSLAGLAAFHPGHALVLALLSILAFALGWAVCAALAVGGVALCAIGMRRRDIGR